MLLILQTIGWTLLAVWLLWIMFVCVMRLQMLRNKGALTTGQKVFGYPTLMVGLLLDFVVNIIICTIVFVELPREWTVSARLWRHSNDGRGWRKKVATFLRVELLDSVDPDGIHKG